MNQRRTPAAQVRYRFAVAADREQIARILRNEGLPTSDLQAGATVLLVAEAAGRPVGCVGIEPHGDSGLIRSLAVVPAYRGAGLGRSLATRAQAFAAATGLHALYLLTTTAEAFWLARGYVPIDRTDAPAPIRASSEFASLCPATAVCMRRCLRGGPRATMPVDGPAAPEGPARS